MIKAGLDRTRFRQLLASAVGLLAWAATASAEVRLQSAGGAQHVLVQQTDRGVWSPVGRADPGVLNPHGDLVGDAMPAIREGERAFAAWHRPSDASIRVARGQDAGWVVVADIEASGPLAVPLIAADGEDAVLVWTAHSTPPITRTVSVSSPDETVLEIPGAVAVDAWFSGDRLLLATFEPRVGGGGDVVINVIINPIEEPELLQSIVLDAGSDLGAASQSRRVELRLDNAKSAEALGWWATPSTLRMVAIEDGQVVLPVREHRKAGGGDYSPSLWNQALKELRRDLD